MKTLRSVMLGLGVVGVCLSGCAERPGKKKDDKKADGDKADAGAKAKGDKKKE